MKIKKPTWYQKSVFAINYDRLKEDNIQLLIFDLDNTIAFIHEKKPSQEIITLFQKLNKMFTVYVASNSPRSRVEKFCQDLHCHYLSNMLKPSKRVYRHLLKESPYQNSEVCIIGDQMLTDMILGHRLGIMTILVDPLGEKDFIVTKINRALERKVLNKLGIKRGKYYEKE